MKHNTYLKRSFACQNNAGQKLLTLMDQKQTNLALSADVTTKSELLSLAETLGDQICVLKTHIDIITDFDPDLIVTLKSIAKEKNFLLFEDRKFADIGNTVKRQYRDGIYHIASWADFINAHIIPGPGIIQGLKDVGAPVGAGLLLLAQMSSKGALTDEPYQQRCLDYAASDPEFVTGFICQYALSTNPGHIHFSPGVHLSHSEDTIGQQYRSPKMLIQGGADVIISGRGILQANNSLSEAKKYREAGWLAYENRLP